MRVRVNNNWVLAIEDIEYSPQEKVLRMRSARKELKFRCTRRNADAITTALFKKGYFDLTSAGVSSPNFKENKPAEERPAESTPEETAEAQESTTAEAQPSAESADFDFEMPEQEAEETNV